jgi:hypothetical protein
MASATVRRVFEVDAPLEEAWQRLAEVERWPEWAPHITSVTVSPPGELGPTSRGALQIKRLGRNTFRMSVWEPPVRWEWVGGLVGVRIFYDHRFESSGPAATRLEWLVELHGPWRRSFELSSPGCTAAISTGRSPDCRSGFAADGRERRQVFGTGRSNRRRRAGSARMSISMILAPQTVNPITASSRPPVSATRPAVPFTSAGRADGARWAKASACVATARAPRGVLEAHRPVVGSNSQCQ